MRPWHLSFFALLCVTGCESTPAANPESVTQPRSAQFHCSGGQGLQVETLGSTVNVTKDDGTVVALTAQPAGSRSRFAEGINAIVFDGRDALFMQTGKDALECKR